MAPNDPPPSRRDGCRRRHLDTPDDLRRAARFEVIECGSADEAIDLLRGGTRVSTVFSDIRLPGSINGLGLAKTVRQEFPDLPILLASSDLPRDDSTLHDGFFAKPYDPRTIVEAIRSVVARNGSGASPLPLHDRFKQRSGDPYDPAG
ncbi:response regulator [Bradyrhizobium sp. 39]|uniref:response regulator n=1 Tax=Bradyrhizobium sp. 39 TaxID=2782673 RepID=UPI001FF8861F|nr:response regulator [Bradyrhizobium sp. 39]